MDDASPIAEEAAHTRRFRARFARMIQLTVLLLVIVLPAFSCADEWGVKNLPGDLLRDLSALPSQENVWWTLVGTGTCLLVYEFKDPDGAERAFDRGEIDKAVDLGNIWGDVRVQGPLSLGSWIVGSVGNYDEMAGLGYDLSRSLLLTSGVVGALKISVSRTRPNGADLSFPSGHTASAFSAAAVLGRRYGVWMGSAGVGLGVLTALGRLEDRKHYASDVVAGAAIGWIIGRTAARDDGGELESTFRLVPLSRGFAIARRF